MQFSQRYYCFSGGSSGGLIEMDKKMTVETNVFQDIIDRKIPAEILYENPFWIVIRDVNPKAYFHLLVICKDTLPDIRAIADDYPFLAVTIKAVTRQLGISDYRLIINNGPKAGQTVPRLHAHILAPNYGEVLADF